MDCHERGGDQANHMFGHRLDHLLATLAANQFGFASLFSHGRVPYESVDQFRTSVKATPRSSQME
jgi:hypothetical protein